MKKIFITLLFCLFIQHIIAQVYYFKGEWTKVNTQELFTGIFKITIKDKSIVTGELIWTYRAIDSKQQDLVEFYKGKKGRVGQEYTSGLFDDKTNDIYFEGTEKKIHIM